MRKEININNILVGELYLYYQFGNLSSQADDAKMHGFIQQEIQMCANGAIDFECQKLKYADLYTRRIYEGFLTVFVKENDTYRCLHNEKSYATNDANIKNLVPLKSLLPKLDYEFPEMLSVNRIKELFNILFRSSSVRKLYQQETHPISDFYVGDYYINEGFERGKIGLSNPRHHYQNLPQRILLTATGASLSASYGYKEDNIEWDEEEFRCLFFKNNTLVYNINDSQFCLEKDRDDEKDSLTYDTKPYCCDLKPLSEELEERNLKVPKTLTIPKALKLVKKKKLL